MCCTPLVPEIEVAMVVFAVVVVVPEDVESVEVDLDVLIGVLVVVIPDVVVDVVLLAVTVLAVLVVVVVEVVVVKAGIKTMVSLEKHAGFASVQIPEFGVKFDFVVLARANSVFSGVWLVG